MVEKRPQYPGQCMLCKRIVNRAQITQHLKKCVREHTPSDGRLVSLFHIAARGSHLPMYWIHMEIPGAYTLDDLDRYLRGIWLECCDHMSCFTIEGQRYSVEPLESILFGWRERTMTQKIYAILSPGMKFTHEYDYGSTTDLSLRVVGLRKAKVKSRGITLLARNEPPAWPCSNCGKTATRIRATGWGLDLDSLFCDDCVEADPGEYLPVVNSPRVGTCGYCG